MLCLQDDEDVSTEEKIQPTHYSELDVKTMNVTDLRNELKARNLNSKGLKSQLAARLSKVLKTEAAEKNDVEDLDGDVVDTTDIIKEEITSVSNEKDEKRSKVNSTISPIIHF